MMFLSKSKIQSQEDLAENAYCNSCGTISALYWQLKWSNDDCNILNRWYKGNN